ncbi:ribonuclease H-like domain-containing protein [Tanacetum coccineum]|uniref:Ribonuclease H-like domain-containing protein n=1 Tax=Tanacetum coccineum TaxID=301880 RepID=A0ABQ4XYW1_9ASTR
MSVHNSEHNSPINSDDDDVHDPVTRISKLDINDPLHLHPNDTTALTVVSIKLKGTENYQVWSCAMLLALEGKNKIGFIDGSCKRSNTDEVLGKQWDRVNAIVLGWILNSISEELFLSQIFSKRAKHVWEELKETYDKVDGSIMFGLHNQINTLKHNGSFIADYYHKLNALWKQFDAMIELPKCVCNTSESFKKHKTLPDVRSAYATISSKESHRVIVGNIAGSSQRNQASAFVSNVPNSQNFQRSNQNFSVGPSRPNHMNNTRQGRGSGLNNNRPSGGFGLVCENCRFNGHTIDSCFKIIGYPIDFGKKKCGQNFKKQSVSNNNYVRKSSSYGFVDEQMATLISLIKNNKVGKNVHANMEVGHLNGTEAYISKIGNLRLSNGLTLYDVMVIPEYCVTLISDLNLKNILGIGEQCEGLYYYNDKGIKSNTSTLRFQCMLSQHDWHYRLGHPADHVLNVLKDSLNIDKKDNTGGIPLKMWTECILTATYLINRLPSSVLDEKFPYEMIYKKYINHINFFDIEYPEIPNDDERVANDLNKGKSDSSSSSVSGSNVNTSDFPVDSGNDADSSNDFVATQNKEVATLKENVLSGAPKYSHWNDAMNQEIDDLLRNCTWELVDLPEGRKAIRSKWIYKIKFRSSGEIDRYKARLIAQGFGQKKGIDYKEAFSPVVKMVTVRCLLNVVVSMSWHVFQLDMNNSFLYGDLEEAPLTMNAKLTSTLIENEFRQSKSDYSLYTKSDKGEFLAFLVYVDDIIITGNSVYEIKKFKVFLKSKFMIKDLGKLKYFLGIEVVDTDKGIFLNQRKYVLDLLSEYAMLACKPAKTPLMFKLVISNEASDKDPLLENITHYHKLMEKLIYLINTRLDISYVVHCLSQFMHSPLTSHLKIAFKILRYLKSCPGLGVHVTKTSDMFLIAYSDADWAKYIVTRKSVTGYCVFLNNSLVSLKSKKQNTLFKSSTEAEYRALALVTSEVIWILKIIKDLQIEILLSISLHCDSNSAIKIVVIPHIITPKGWRQFALGMVIKNLVCLAVYQIDIREGVGIKIISLNRLNIYVEGLIMSLSYFQFSLVRSSLLKMDIDESLKTVAAKFAKFYVGGQATI